MNKKPDFGFGNWNVVICFKCNMDLIVNYVKVKRKTRKQEKKENKKKHDKPMFSIRSCG